MLEVCIFVQHKWSNENNLSKQNKTFGCHCCVKTKRALLNKINDVENIVLFDAKFV